MFFVPLQETSTMLNLYQYYNKPTELRHASKYLTDISKYRKSKLSFLEHGFTGSNIFHILKKTAQFSYNYSRYYINGRWLEAEPYIMKNPMYAFMYAKFVIEDRWHDAESHIMKDPEFAYLYATDIIRGRWKEAEPYIKKNKTIFDCYNDALVL